MSRLIENQEQNVTQALSTPIFLYITWTTSKTSLKHKPLQHFEMLKTAVEITSILVSIVTVTSLIDGSESCRV